MHTQEASTQAVETRTRATQTESVGPTVDLGGDRSSWGRLEYEEYLRAQNDLLLREMDTIDSQQDRLRGLRNALQASNNRVEEVENALLAAGDRVEELKTERRTLRASLRMTDERVEELKAERDDLQEVSSATPYVVS